MPTNNRPKTVSANMSVCTSGVVALASTIAAPVGRSVIDSSKLILIMPLPLLSRRDRRQLPYQERSLSCSPGQIFCRQLLSDETDQTIQPVFRNAWRDIRASREASNRLLLPESSEWLPRSPPQSLYKNPSSYVSLRQE